VSDKGYYGHKTLSDGTHLPLSAEEAERLWHDIEAKAAERAARLPDEKACLNAMMDAYVRLRELGWSDAIYCPKDGTPFQVIEAGSTGIFDCHYEGTWPKGSWWVSDGGDLWPSRPILFRPTPKP
jgi:hypothetical protein